MATSGGARLNSGEAYGALIYTILKESRLGVMLTVFPID
jgi:hypothetical protein